MQNEVLVLTLCHNLMDEHQLLVCSGTDNQSHARLVCLKRVSNGSRHALEGDVRTLNGHLWVHCCAVMRCLHV